MNIASDFDPDAKQSKRLLLFEEVLREESRFKIGDIAGSLARKGYSYTEKKFSEIETESKSFRFRINYAGKKIDIAAFPARTNNTYAATVAKRLQAALFYRPILDILQRTVAELPDYFDLDQQQIMSLKIPLVINSSAIEGRIAKEFNEDFIDAVASFLDQDFPGISEKYSVAAMTEYLKGVSSPGL